MQNWGLWIEYIKWKTKKEILKQPSTLIQYSISKTLQMETSHPRTLLKYIFADKGQKIKEFLSSTLYLLFMSVLTIWTIFAIDVDKGFFSQSASIYFSTAHVIAMFIFVIEIILTSIVEKDYLFQFYFWIDIFSTLMMLLQLIWVEDIMNSTDNIQVAISFARVSKASRFSKIGSRSTKIMKLIRLIKLMKLFKTKDKEIEEMKLENKKDEIDIELEKQNEQGSEMDTLSSNIKGLTKKNFTRPNVDPIEQGIIDAKWEELSQKQKKNLEEKPKEQTEKGTKVGELLKYSIQKNIVIMVMGLIMIVPILSASTWYNKTEDMEPSTGPYLAMGFNETNSQFVSSWYQSFVEVSLNSSHPVVMFNISSPLFVFPKNESYLPSIGVNPISDLRSSEKTIIENTTYWVCFSKKTENKITSWINILRSILIIVLLLITSVVFIKDLDIYALNPLEKMNNTVSKIEKNPFSVLQNEEDFEEETEEEHLLKKKESGELELETNILENFFIKITSFLALGVGETPLSSGSSTDITEDKNKSNIFSDLDCVRVEGIFVCIQLASLEELGINFLTKTSLFVNLIIQVFHETVIENGGYIFHQDEQYSVVCWKFPNEIEKQSIKSISLRSEERKSAELSFVAYLKFIEKLGQNQQIKKFELEHDFMFNETDAKFHLGFHYGVAYCGAIGSEFKLSLKAMGPDISIAKSLCKAAKNFKLDNMISEKFMKIAPFATALCRKIQEFKYIDGQRMPTVQGYSLLSCSNLRTVVRVENLEFLGHDDHRLTIEQREIKKIQKMFKIREDLLKNCFKNKMFDLNQLSRTFFKKYPNTEEYLDLWRESCICYEEGQWCNAKIGYQHSKEFNLLSNDIITELRLQEIGNREEPSYCWKKSKPISLFL